jgi:hypothetical protein
MNRWFVMLGVLVIMTTLSERGRADDAKANAAKQTQKWLQAYLASNLNGLASLYADDALLMPGEVEAAVASLRRIGEFADNSGEYKF